MSINFSLLFRSKKPLVTEGLPFLTGGEEHTEIAVRNTSGKANLSSQMAKGLYDAIKGGIQGGWFRSITDMTVTANSTSSGTVKMGVVGDFLYFPHGGEATLLNYHFVSLGICQALAEPGLAVDFWKAYIKVLQRYEIKSNFEAGDRFIILKACDELYYWLRYHGDTVDPANELGTKLDASDSLKSFPSELEESNFRLKGSDKRLPVECLTDSSLLANWLSGASIPMAVPTSSKAASKKSTGFVGWQAQAIKEAIEASENVLLAGPTGTGKTFVVQQVTLELDYSLVVIEGKEGLTDLDFLGAILPRPDGSRAWVDGPLLRAMRLAQNEPVCLFLDEFNRIPRVMLNIVIGLLNPKSQKVCKQMGIEVGEGNHYVVEVPMTSEVVTCPIGAMRIIAAGNFGMAYAVCQVDPALRRRFETVIEFEYLTEAEEVQMLKANCGLEEKVALSLAKLAGTTRVQMRNGEIPGCIDTASLLNWGRKCARVKAKTLEAVMTQGRRVWADFVCGRDHTGRVEEGTFMALQDTLKATGLLR